MNQFPQGVVGWSNKHLEISQSINVKLSAVSFRLLQNSRSKHSENGNCICRNLWNEMTCILVSGCIFPFQSSKLSNEHTFINDHLHIPKTTLSSQKFLAKSCVSHQDVNSTAEVPRCSFGQKLTRRSLCGEIWGRMAVEFLCYDSGNIPFVYHGKYTRDILARQLIENEVKWQISYSKLLLTNSYSTFIHVR